MATKTSGSCASSWPYELKSTIQMPLNLNAKPSLVVYVTCGDPDLPTTRTIVLAAIDAGAQVVELGVPFSDPVADGPVIQRASERALRNGTTLAQALELARELRKQRPKAGLIVFSYLNPVLRLGLARFCAAAADAGVDGALITDLTVDEAGDYLRAMRARELATVFLAAPTSTDQRLKRIAAASRGFVYAVSRTGVTGTREEVAADARELVRRLRKFTRLPIAVGFGISTPAHFAEVGEFADAAVVGSAIVQAIEQAGRERAPQAVAELVSSLLGRRQSREHSAISTQHSAM
ncbi:MAG: tryptophan synthase subunit alpha [Terriglobales bacterium]